MHAFPPVPPASPRCLRPLAVIVFGGFTLLASCVATSDEPAHDVSWLVDHGQFEAAVRQAADEVAKHPNDAQAEANHRTATVALLLEKGRRLTFDDKDEEALALFTHVTELDPTSTEAVDWKEKTNRKLAERFLAIGLDQHASDDIPGALASYEKALAYEPGLQNAQAGRAITLLLLQYRAGLGHRYFDEGLHDLSDYWLEQARSRFSYAEKYRKDDTRTVDRKRQVQTLLAIQRISSARNFEEAHRYGAAYGDYRIAKSLDPDSVDAKNGADRCKIEMDVAEKLKSARFEVTKGRFDKAADLTAAALAATVAQKDMCEGVMAEIRDARFEKSYKDALALERDYRFAEAATHYGDLIAEAGFYKDAITRKDTLDEYVKRAAQLYGSAQSAPDAAARLGFLRQIAIFWPEYKDVSDQIHALENPPGR